MVVSRLDSSISYPEYAHIEEDDISYNAPLFEVNIIGVNVIISLGKVKYQYAKTNNIVYIPMYVMNTSDEVYKKIGIIEMRTSNVIMDDDGDVDLMSSTFQPLLFSNVTKELLHKSLIDPNTKSRKDAVAAKEDQGDEDDAKKGEDAKKREDEKKGEDAKKGEDDEDDDDDAKKGEDEEQEEDEDEDEEDVETIIELDSEIAPLPLQTRDQSELERKQYSPQEGDLWIQKYMRNKYFSIIDNEGSSDGLFAVIRDGLLTHGKKTTVLELRKQLADEVTDDIFQTYRENYIMYQNTVKTQMSELKDLTERHNSLKERIKNVHDRAQQQLMIIEGKKISAEHTAKKREVAFTKQIYGELDFMTNIKTLEQCKKVIQTSIYWPDKWAVATMERILNMKFIMLSSSAYKSGDIENVVICGGDDMIDPSIGLSKRFEPNSYIIVEVDGSIGHLSVIHGNSSTVSERTGETVSGGAPTMRTARTHYRLITYKAHGLLSFSEIPYDIKLLITSKCLETQAGAFCMIPQFKLFQKELGIQVVDPVSIDDIIEEMPTNRVSGEVSGLYNPDIVFQFYDKSDSSPLPGNGSGEKIPLDEKKNFERLSSTKDWRKMLSNFWAAPFTLDGHTWQTVEHYYQGSKYKNNNKEFYLKFSLDSRSEIASDPVLAKAAGGKTGKLKGALLRPRNVVVDPDFFGGRNEREMEAAMYAKFSQNRVLQVVLLATRNAKLVHYVRGAPPVVFNHLMRVRHRLREEVSA
jgi:predicted NAD-dependent protein-ADP-ribosyltransferase YbiA (DUF1768 family)